MKRLFILFFLLLSISSLSAQSKFEQNYVFVARKVGKKMPGVFSNGAMVNVYLNTGKKVKGQMLIYTEYIDVDGEQIYPEDIVAIKRQSNQFYERFAGSLAFSELIGRGFIERGVEGLGLRTGVQLTFSALSIQATEKRYKKKKGWTYELMDTAPMLEMRRNR